MHDQIIRLLDQHRLKEALNSLGEYKEEIPWNFRSEVENLKLSYDYMLQYASQGAQDPEREKLYATFLRRMYELTDYTDFVLRAKKNNGFFSELFQKGGDRLKAPGEKSDDSLKDLKGYIEKYTEEIGVSELTLSDKEYRKDFMKQLQAGCEHMIDWLFGKIWISGLWTEDEERDAYELLSSPTLSPDIIAVMVGGVTMGLLKMFDKRKFQFLLTAYISRKELIITQRALVGIALAAYYSEDRLSMYPELLSELSLLGESTSISKELYNIQSLFLLSRETEKIDKTMREEIIPHLMKKTKLPNQNLSFLDIEDMIDRNPEWEKQSDELQEIMNKIGDLQSEGADTLMSTFSQLKNYPFFVEAAHWFYPFDKHNSHIRSMFSEGNTGRKTLIDMILASPTFCHSDKYSFCLSLLHIDAAKVAQMNSDVPGPENLMQETIDAMNIENSVITTRQYIHDLYRFYKLWRYKNELHDIFSDPMSFWKCKALKPLLATPENLRSIANKLLERNYLQEASELYTELSKTPEADADIWQKLAFTLQKMKRYDEAIQAYLKADLLKPDHFWTLKHLAQCYRRTGNFQLSLEYLQRIISMKPDDLSIVLQIGQCYTVMGMYDKALPNFFKVEFLGQAPEKAWRAIGWCHFMSGKIEEAGNFYRKLTESEKVQPSDWLNYGHVALVQNRIPDALVCYRKAEEGYGSHEEFLKAFIADKSELMKHGITENTLFIVPDML